MFMQRMRSVEITILKKYHVADQVVKFAGAGQAVVHKIAVLAGQFSMYAS